VVTSAPRSVDFEIYINGTFVQATHRPTGRMYLRYHTQPRPHLPEFILGMTVQQAAICEPDGRQYRWSELDRYAAELMWAQASAEQGR
jgi:hypothetical protein